MTATASALFGRIEGDAQRVKRDFSIDVLKANALLHNPAASDDEMREGLLDWCAHHQPCMFGRSAAKQGRLHFSILRDKAIREWSDEEIAAKIAEDRRLWKQRALSNVEQAAHSFILVVASPVVAFAAPDRSLREFSEKILELAGWSSNRKNARRVNDVSSDYLYLRCPNDDKYYGFQFNLDFFACAGDRRWWHDHRFPGGIAFTANSTGHFRAFLEWYAPRGKSDIDAMLGLAMRTIASAAPTKSLIAGDKPPKDVVDPVAEGRVTWLVNLDSNGMPLLSDVSPPWNAPPSDLAGKDWTRYEGFLHTDHAVREEFFDPRDVPATKGKPYRMDFTYLYNEKEADFLEFTGGREFTKEEIYSELGTPDTWTHRAAEEISRRSEEDAQKVAEQLQALRQLDPSPWIPRFEE